jgi:hypothetical protein
LRTILQKGSLSEARHKTRKILSVQYVVLYISEKTNSKVGALKINFSAVCFFGHSSFSSWSREAAITKAMTDAKKFALEKQFFGFEPVHFIDDVINHASDFMGDACDAFQSAIMAKTQQPQQPETPSRKRVKSVTEESSDAEMIQAVRWFHPSFCRYRYRTCH